MRPADKIQPLPKTIDPMVLTYARLAMATMSTQTFEVFPDGALCDRQLYDLFADFKAKVAATSTRRDNGNR